MPARIAALHHVVALRCKQVREVVEARARIGMLGSQRLLADRQCPLVKSRNHLVDQIESFRIGDKDNKREDDLLDTFCYGTAIGLGNSEGF